MNLFLIIALITIILTTAGWWKSTDKKKYLTKNVFYLALSLILLLLFGPLFGLSPLKIGYQTQKIENKTIIYPHNWQDEQEKLVQLVDQAEEEVLVIFPQQLPVTFILVKNNFDLLRFTGQRKGGNNFLGKVYIADGSMDKGVITHELAHYYLHQTIAGPSFSLPRWFDEGLATYLGHSDSMTRFTQPETLERLLNDNHYPKDLNYWNGFGGQLRWMWQIYRGGYVSYMYTHSYYLIKFLIKEYGLDNFQALIEKLENSSSFEKTFQSVYGFTSDQFNNNFINSSRLGTP